MRASKITIRMIVDVINEEWFRSRKGSKISKAVVERMIKNLFYYGVIEYAWELYEWKHQALISKELWDKANKISRNITYVLDKDLSSLKWKVIHEETWTVMTVSLIKKKYIYFHLHWDKKQSLWLNQKEIIKVFDENLHFYCIPEDFKDEVKEWLKEFHLNEIDENEKTRKWFESKIKKLQNEKTSLIKMRSLGEISSEELIESKNSIINELASINDQLFKLDQKDRVLIENLDKTVELFVELNNKRKLLNDEQKLNIITSMVIELQVDNKKRLKIVENKLFKAFRKYNFNKWWSTIIELRTFFESSLEYDITTLYKEDFINYFKYKWKPIEYYRRKKKNAN